MRFETMIREASRRNRSRIVLALDLEDHDAHRLATNCKDVLQRVSSQICGVKINRQLVLSLGLKNGVDLVVKLAHDFSLPVIMDAKLNDVGHTNEFMMRSYIKAGFDAIIASPIVGWKDGLDGVFSMANSAEKAVILLVYMSNPGAEEHYALTTILNGKPRLIYELLTERAIQWKAHGVIVGATRPEIIRQVRGMAGSKLTIYCPGVGAQGGDPGKALSAGADYLIVGRAIYSASDPVIEAERLRCLP